MTSLPCLRDMWTANGTGKKNRLGHDLMISAVSIVHDAPIITANPKDYVRINTWFSLPGVYQPLEERWYVEPDRPVWLPALNAREKTPTSIGRRRSIRECSEQAITM
ncbi:hypothetical protein J2045_001945 [Peteryoungia aggregata LMG 23059]|uniref:Type II toxin-antitoxin system VapC family toxin n=1 Tax=Peteryoungia aggregata LMG 23059 TaxID=1368425 RepID=A0ABU0G6E6_9HYPH|nr:hypothetical protein [Peteryoungia aggregata LMG 23059]